MSQVSIIKGWGDTKQDCIEYLNQNPGLKAQGYRVAKLGNVWVVGK